MKLWHLPCTLLETEIKQMERPFGIDLNEFDAGKGKVDFEKIQAHEPEVSFIAARTGVSLAYQDPKFSEYWTEIGRIGAYRLAYHVVHFGDSALNQMDNLFRTVSGDSNWAVDRLALAFEVAGLNSKARITSTALRCLEICKTRTGFYPIVFTNADWMNQNLDPTALPRLNYWLSTYERDPLPLLYAREHSGPPVLPMGVSNWLIQQTSKKSKPIGSRRHYMHYNRFNGSMDDLHFFFGKASQVSAPIESPVLFPAHCIVTALYTRGGPGASYPVLGTISLGDSVDVYELRDGWFRIDPSAQVWCSGSRSYMLPKGAETVEEAALYQVRVLAPGLYKRSGPGSDFEVLGNLVRDEIASVYEEKDGWLRIKSGLQVWCSGGSQYVEKIENLAAEG